VSCTALLVDTSGGVAARLTGVFEGELELVAHPVAPSGALDLVRRLDPKLVVVEVVDGTPEVVRLVERLMSDLPRPIALVARTQAARHVAFRLLDAGALDVESLTESLSPEDARALRSRMLLLSSVRVVRHPKGHRRRSSAILNPAPVESQVIAIAASLGGPRALAEVLADLPTDLRAPVLICQHITPGFSTELATWLGNETGHHVREALDGQRLVKGECYVAPAHLHMMVSPHGTVRLDNGPHVGGFKPSCNLLLRSVAQVFGPRAIGVVLTGMGKDGAQGLLDIRRANGHTIAQDQGTSVVFGMPGEAVALGAAELTLPLCDIGAQLARWVS
jgi:two-component system, chemotaxis family, protein-glutamate methylesterase/glutaminase